MNELDLIPPGNDSKSGYHSRIPYLNISAPTSLPAPPLAYPQLKGNGNLRQQDEIDSESTKRLRVTILAPQKETVKSAHLFIFSIKQYYFSNINFFVWTNAPDCSL